MHSIDMIDGEIVWARGELRVYRQGVRSGKAWEASIGAIRAGQASIHYPQYGTGHML